MREYGKVHGTFWSSDTTSHLSDDAKILALYLMTSPHATIAGVFRLPEGYICEDLRWVTRRVGEGFAELFAKGFCNRCETTNWVWVRKHFKWNPPENPNQRKAARKVADQVPDACSWKSLYFNECGEFFDFQEPEKKKGLPKGSKRVSKPGTGTGTGTGTEKHNAPSSALALLKSEGVAEQVAKDWIEVRRKKRAPDISETVVTGLRREAQAAGLSVGDAVRECVERNWQGFKASWVNGAARPGAVNGSAGSEGPRLVEGDLH